jgi:hypothetical protein
MNKGNTENITIVEKTKLLKDYIKQQETMRLVHIN